MKQIIQDLKSGETILADVPTPQIKFGSVLIQTTHSLVSLGTERMLIEFGKANLVQKARQQPEKVKQVLDKIKSDGLLPTLEAVFNKLDQPLPMGYCNVGRVIAVGTEVTSFKIGDRVVSNGPHAEVVCVPQNLVAPIPDEVSDQDAAFTVIGAIGLQGIRLLNPTFGEAIVVIGLGLIGLITAELLKANGCTVIGFDFDANKVELAKQKGIHAVCLVNGTNPVQFVETFTQGIGADGVIITASNKSDEIISNAAKMSRKKGRIVLVGVIGLNLNRADFYEKELTFQVSCSYGPGRYDNTYEQKGLDYPLPYVRWTEKRNFEAILNAISTRQIDVKPFITEEISLYEFQKIYGKIGLSNSIASILVYPQQTPKDQTLHLQLGITNLERSEGQLGIIGAGNFTASTVLPAFKKAGIPTKWIASAKGLSGTIQAQKFGIEKATTNYQEILQDSSIDAILVTTQHNSHAKFVIESLNAGKHVFVEKPLCLTQDELLNILTAQQTSQKSITVGFNRRFSTHIQKLKGLLGCGENPINVVATMNAGYIPSNVWVHDMQLGGGRIIGEACHYLDLVRFLCDSPITSVCMNAMGKSPQLNADNASILVKFKNGSNAVINYFSNGNKSYSKERIEVFSDQRVAIMDNFRITEGFGFKGFSKLKTKQDKGHGEQFRRFYNMIKQGEQPIIPLEQIVNVTLATLASIESLKTGQWVEVAASVIGN
ncbi:MAG: bi-domain-containing oxidoreductase [Rhodothermia bacterium]|nr:bi-domain-containing oxidoreductase [Rhodothermia bacterium]